MKPIQLIPFAIVILIILFVFNFAVMAGPPAWTGFGESIKAENTIPAKTLWDWMELLIIPFAVLIIGWTFSKVEKVKATKREEERSQNEMLESFFQTMTKLLIEHNLSVNPTLQLLSIARARINIAVKNLDGYRKGQILQFLYESKLINFDPTIELVGLDFRNAFLDEIVLGNSEIKGTYFNNASMKNANLSEAKFIACDFSDANLSGSTVPNADFSYSYLNKANLMNMDLTTVNFEGCELSGANLKGSKILKTQLDSIQKKEKIKLTKNLIL